MDCQVYSTLQWPQRRLFFLKFWLGQDSTQDVYTFFSLKNNQLMFSASVQQKTKQRKQKQTNHTVNLIHSVFYSLLNGNTNKGKGRGHARYLSCCVNSPVRTQGNRRYCFMERNSEISIFLKQQFFTTGLFTNQGKEIKYA